MYFSISGLTKHHKRDQQIKVLHAEIVLGTYTLHLGVRWTEMASQAGTEACLAISIELHARKTSDANAVPYRFYSINCECRPKILPLDVLHIMPDDLMQR